MPTTTPTQTRELLTLTEAASQAGVTTRTIRNWIAAGQLAGHRVGPRLIRVHRDELAAIIRPIPAASAAARR